MVLVHQEVMLRLALAAVLGGAVGLERERLEWVAGLRTHMLVCVGAALVMIVSAFGFADVLGSDHVVLDPSRVAAQVVSGVGFLGAGTILFLRHQVIRGLTTAASLWTVAAIGLAAGGGLYFAAFAATALVIVILALVKPLERRLFHRDQARRVTVVVDHAAMLSLARIEAEVAAAGVAVREMTLRRGEDGEDSLDFALSRAAPRDAMHEVASRLRSIEGVRGVTV